MKYPSKSAFSLVELLLSVVVFVVVGSFALVTLSSTVKLQSVYKRSQQVTLQTNQILATISSEIEHSIYDQKNASKPELQGLKTVPLSTSNYGNNSISELITFIIPNTDSKGLAIPDSYIRRIYCAEPQKNGAARLGARLVRFTIISIPLPVTPTQNMTLSDCNEASIRGFFPGIPPNQMKKELLGDENLDIKTLRFSPVNSRYDQTQDPNNDFYDAAGIRIQITAQYSGSLGKNEEKRATDTLASPQISLSKMVSRNPFYTINQ